MTPTGTPTRTALYLRQSLDKHGDMLAVDRQRDGCRALCADRGWTDLAEYIDNDTSATNGKPRPAYARLLADIDGGKVTALVVWDLDRLYRQPRELEDLIDLADEKHLALATVTGDVDLSNDNGRLYARIKGAVAKAEVERKSARQKAAARQHADRGGYRWPSRPFGFAYGPDNRPALDDNGRPTFDRREARLIRQAYRDVLGGASLYAIASGWNARGITTPKGNRWSGTQLRDLLTNPRNAGLRSYRGEIVGDAVWAPLVDRDVFDGVNAILADPARISGHSRARKYLLVGLARCHKCSKTVQAHITANGRVIYACKERGCFAVARDQASVDLRVVGYVVERLSQPDATDLLVAATTDATAELRDRARALRAQIDESRQLYEDSVLTAAELTTTRANLTAKLADVEARLHDTHRAEVFGGVVGAEDVGEAFDNLTLDRQRAIVDALVTVVIKPVGKGCRTFDPKSVETIGKL
jgi:DNA invertase Pin-like site-specific DNA recombinase